MINEVRCFQDYKQQVLFAIEKSDNNSEVRDLFTIDILHTKCFIRVNMDIAK